MTPIFRVSCQSLVLAGAALSLVLAGASFAAAQDDKKSDRNRKPSVSVRASPTTGFSPLRVVVTAELKGGANDFEDFYCAAVEWDWGDDTRSESKIDCEPYEAGTSEIKRRYVEQHTFRAFSMDIGPDQPTTQFRVRFNLKQNNKVVGSGSTTVELRGGMAPAADAAASAR